MTPSTPDIATSNSTTVAVWDPLLRIFHWSLAGFFFIAWFSAEESGYLHEWSGYTLVALIAFRLLWGLIGTHYARLGTLLYSPREVIAYLSGLVSGRVRHYLGHNPAGSAMAIALLLCIAALAITGMGLAGSEGHGPLAGSALAALGEDPLEEIHEFFANLTMTLVVLHVAGVAISSLRHRENLVLSMFTGRKRAAASHTEEKA